MKVLVDYSWLHYRAAFAFQRMSAEKNGVKFTTGGLFGTHRAIFNILDRHPDADIILCIDGIPLKNNAEQSTYKGNRDSGEMDERSIPISTLKIAKALLSIKNVSIAYHPEQEADETIAFLCEMKDNDETYVVLSTDGDLRQLIDSSKKIYCSKTEYPDFDLEDEEKLFTDGPKDLRGLYPTAIPLYKAVCGDTSDNIAGVPRFPHDLMRKLANEFRTIDNLRTFLKSYQGTAHLSAYRTLKKHWELIESNYRLALIDPNFVPEIYEQFSQFSFVDDFDLVEFYEYYDAITTLSHLKKLNATEYPN
jgi:DNA polymerase-1